MQKTLSKLSTLVLIALVAVGTASCEKSKLNKATTSSEDNELAETLFNDVYDVVEEVTKE